MKIIICGEINEARICEQLLRDVALKCNEYIEVTLINSGKQLLYYTDSLASDVDLVYLEYDLADGNGIEIAKEIRKQLVPIDIVLCADDNAHISEGYDVDAIYYIVKHNISKEKFEEIFIKALSRANSRKKQFLSLFCAGDNLRIDIDTIRYFEVKNRIVTVYYGDNKFFEFYSTLSRLEEVLYSKGFIRIHQAFLVSKKHIHKANKNCVILTDGTELPIGRSHQRQISMEFQGDRSEVSLYTS